MEMDKISEFFFSFICLVCVFMCYRDKKSLRPTIDMPLRLDMPCFGLYLRLFFL